MTGTPEFRWQAVGRRKTSVARVYLTPGTGKWDVNGRTLGDYFPRPTLVSAIQQPFTLTDTLGRFDVKARLDGGGMSGRLSCTFRNELNPTKMISARPFIRISSLSQIDPTLMTPAHAAGMDKAGSPLRRRESCAFCTAVATDDPPARD